MNTKPLDTNADAASYVKSTPLTFIEKLDVIDKAEVLYKKVVAMYPAISERPRLSSWYDQLERCSLSVSLNIWEGAGRGRKYATNFFLISRGSLLETYGALRVGPQHLCEPLLADVQAISLALDNLIIKTS